MKTSTDAVQAMAKPRKPNRRLTKAEHARIATAHLNARERAERSPYILSTAILARGMIFQPTTAPGFLDTYSTPVIAADTCTTQVHGRLGQTHAAVLEGLWMRAVRKRDTADGGVVLTVPRAALLQDLGTLREYGADSLRELLSDLQEARFRLSAFKEGLWGPAKDGTPAPDFIEGGFVRRCTSRTVAPYGVRLTITLDPAYLLILRHDQAPSGRSRLPVAHLRHGLSRAVARWLLSESVSKQPKGGWHLDTVLEKLLGPRTPKERTWDRDRIRKEENEAWTRCGIQFRDANGRHPRVRLIRYDEALDPQERP